MSTALYLCGATTQAPVRADTSFIANRVPARRAVTISQCSTFPTEIRGLVCVFDPLTIGIWSLSHRPKQGVCHWPLASFCVFHFHCGVSTDIIALRSCLVKVNSAQESKHLLLAIKYFAPCQRHRRVQLGFSAKGICIKNNGLHSMAALSQYRKAPLHWPFINPLHTDTHAYINGSAAMLSPIGSN